jgi:hypothetical protein
MKKMTLIIGIVALLLGTVLLLPYKARTSTVPKAIATRYASAYQGEVGNESWTLSCNLTKGDVVWVDYREGYNWTEGYFDPADDDTGMAVLYVYINMTPISPPGNTTQFLLDTRLWEVSSSQGMGQKKIGWYNLTVEMNGSIDTSPVTNEYGKMFEPGGRIPFDGEYQAVLWTWPERVVPPSYLAFFHNITMTTYPNSYLLPTGGVIVAFGGALSFVGARSVIQENSQKRIRKQKANTR